MRVKSWARQLTTNHPSRYERAAVCREPALIAIIAPLLVACLLCAFAFADAGAETYKTKCAPCHGATGKGDTMIGNNLRIRPLGSAEVQMQSDDEITTIISKGRNRMPAFDRKLTKDQIRDVLRFVRSLSK